MTAPRSSLPSPFPDPGRVSVMVPPPPALPARVERGLGWYAGAGCGVLLFLAVAAILVFSIPDTAALGISMLAAVLPALFYVSVILRLDVFEAEPRSLLLAAFGWGAVGAVVFAIILSLIFNVSFANTGDLGADYLISSAIGAPLIEESCKGLALLAILWFNRGELDNILDGIVYGALVGIGFAMTENILYFGAAYLAGGFGDLGELFVARAVIFGLGHALYSATIGLFVGWSREQYARGIWRFVLPIVGWILAVLQHMLWNAGVIFTSAWLAGSSIIMVVLVDAVFFIVPAALVLFTIARLAHRRELRVLRQQLAPEVARGTLTPLEYETLFQDDQRRQALAAASSRGGGELRRVQQRFFDLAAELAFREYHLANGEQLKPGQLAPNDAYRAELARLRAILALPPAPRLA